MAKTLTKTQREATKNGITIAIISIVVVLLMFPFFVMIVRSFMTEDEIYNFPKLLPAGLEFGNYYDEAYFASFLEWGYNTLTVAVLNIIGTVCSAFLCAYGFAKMDFKSKAIIFAVTMASTMLPSITLRIPLYLMYAEWGWLDGTLKPLIVPAYFGGGALNIFLIMQFIKGIPNSTLESARIDGANEFRCLFSIVLPSCLPIVALISVNTFLGVWNDYSSSLIYLSNSDDKWTLALGFYKTSLEPTFRENKQMAMGVLMCIPSLLVFGFSQKLLIEGVSLSGMKA